jgi:hypothetical protein
MKQRKEKGKENEEGNGWATGRAHLYRGLIPPDTNCHICTGRDNQYKCNLRFVLDGKTPISVNHTRLIHS